MAVNPTVADGGSLTLFASDYNGGMGFASGRTLTVTATFSDGSSAQAVTTVTTSAVTVSAVTPNQGTTRSAERRVGNEERCASWAWPWKKRRCVTQNPV